MTTHPIDRDAMLHLAEGHEPDEHGPDKCGKDGCYPSCAECGDDWPCVTVCALRALDAAESRPLTADDITDEMRIRAWRAMREWENREWSLTHEQAGDMVLRAALTEPPSRPEGAEEIEALMRELVPSHPEDNYGKLADHLASRGLLPPITDKSEPRRDALVFTEGEW
ncbi:hypothetical protein [Brachybacterium sp. AOP3-A1-3]|uniref:hypothetical protein n=1 Tax=Brachybacterium sp. AOP3-A1-3 TaxID=3457699 RepID=UPI0040346B86